MQPLTIHTHTHTRIIHPCDAFDLPVEPFASFSPVSNDTLPVINVPAVDTFHLGQSVHYDPMKTRKPERSHLDHPPRRNHPRRSGGHRTIHLSEDLKVCHEKWSRFVKLICVAVLALRGELRPSVTTTTPSCIPHVCLSTAKMPTITLPYA